MNCYFPVEWRFGDEPGDGINGPAVDDAGTIYIVHGEADEDWPNGNIEAPVLLKKTTLAEMVTLVVDGWKDIDGYTDHECVPASDALATALRDAANLLDARVRPSSQSQAAQPTTEPKTSEVAALTESEAIDPSTSKPMTREAALDLISQAALKIRDAPQNSVGGRWQCGGAYWRIARILELYLDPQLEKQHGKEHAAFLIATYGKIQRG